MESEPDRRVVEAEGYAELGMWQESRDALEDVPDVVLAGLPVLLLRLDVCGGAERLGER